MPQQRQSKTVTQFRGLHAMSATAAPSDKPENSRRASPAAPKKQDGAGTKRNAA